jgi:putative glutamine amidotransferase
MQPPLIGITGRGADAISLFPAEAALLGDEAAVFCFSALIAQVRAAGGIPVVLPHAADGAAALAARLDGLLLSGGEDLDPARSGAAGARTTDPARDESELALLAAARERRVPVLGICRGMQLLSVAFGGRLVDGLDAHDRRDAPFREASHPIRCHARSRVSRLVGADPRVNSVHRQGVEAPGPGLRATAHALDGIVEALEHATEPLLGIQWHPEYSASPDPAFGWLVESARSAL